MESIARQYLLGLVIALVTALVTALVIAPVLSFKSNKCILSCRVTNSLSSKWTRWVLKNPKTQKAHSISAQCDRAPGVILLGACPWAFWIRTSLTVWLKGGHAHPLWATCASCAKYLGRTTYCFPCWTACSNEKHSFDQELPTQSHQKPLVYRRIYRRLVALHHWSRP